MKTTSELVEAVKAHAMAHYNDGGWDVVVECWDDAEIIEHITEAGAKTPTQAIASFESFVSVMAERQADAAYYRREALVEAGDETKEPVMSFDEIVTELLEDGRFVLVETAPIFSRIDDSIIRYERYVVGDYETREAAEAAGMLRWQSIDGTLDIYPHPAATPVVITPECEIPF